MLNWLTIGSRDIVGEWVEVQPAGDDHGGHQLGRRNKGVRLWVGVITTCEVAVVGSHNGVLIPLGNIISGIEGILFVGRYIMNQYRPSVVAIILKVEKLYIRISKGFIS